MLASHLSARAPFGLEGKIEVLELGGVPAGCDACFELWSQALLLAYGFDNRLLAFGNFLEAVVLLGNGSYLHLVERSGALLAVACYEGDCGAVVEEAEGALHLPFAQPRAFSYELGKYACFFSIHYQLSIVNYPLSIITA